MAIRVAQLAKSMYTAAKDVLEEKAPEIKDYAKSEFKKIAESIAMIARLRVKGKITEEQARIHLEIQKNASRTVLLTVEGLGILAVEQAINAALGAVRDTVNTAVGFALL
jgi:23S rRNA pseudoU1915 N3-methylase RlmH